MPSSSTQTTTALLPCPFCGANVEVMAYFNEKSSKQELSVIMCDGCDAQMERPTAEELTASWNRRAA